MKTKATLLIGIATTCLYGLSACNKADDHDHDHDHDHGEEHGDHDHDDHDHGEEGHDDHADHDHGDHGSIAIGPNDGRLLTDFAPPAEFLILDDRKVQLTFTDAEGKAATAVPAGASVSAVVGDRSNPTQLKFAPSGGGLVSDLALPAGKMMDIVLQLKVADGAKSTAKFNLNLNDCPTCDALEYACTCDHSHDE